MSGALEPLPSLASKTLHPTIIDPPHTYTPTSNPPVTPEDPAAKRSGMIKEFWAKSVEIRKSLGQSVGPVTYDPNTQSSSTGDTFYTSTHSTSDSNLPSYTPYKSESINQTSGTITQTAGIHSTQTPSMTDLQNAYTHFQGATSSCGNLHTPETKIENVSIKERNELEEIVDHSLMNHNPDITLEGQVTEEVRGLNIISSCNTSGTQRVSVPDLRFLYPPRSPLVAAQKLDMNRSDPTIHREILLSSPTAPLRTNIVQHDRLNRVQSLPPSEVEVLCAGDVEELHPCPAEPYYSSITEVKRSSLPTKSSGKDETALKGRRALSEVPLQVGGAEACQRQSEIEPLEEDVGKVKKRSSLFSPRKNRKSGNLSGETQQELGKHKSLWKSVFSGYKKEKKRKEIEGYSKTLPSTTSQENRKRMSGFRKTSGKRKGHLLLCCLLV